MDPHGLPETEYKKLRVQYSDDRTDTHSGRLELISKFGRPFLERHVQTAVEFVQNFGLEFPVTSGRLTCLYVDRFPATVLV